MGLIFDIKEFGLHDGRGMRTTVFLKGCPLHCLWCHNPEGISSEIEVARNTGKCTGCGLCRQKCAHEECRGLGVCLKRCPGDYVRKIGREYSPEALAAQLRRNESFLKYGGVTFSGGEPLEQADFIWETLRYLSGLPTAIETCGFVPGRVFQQAIAKINDIFIDIKHIQTRKHRQFTGQGNELILQNVRQLMESRKNFTVRVPLIPGLTDTEENFSGIAEFLAPAKDRVTVELIPYNRMTGAKYRTVGRSYLPCFDETQAVNKDVSAFAERNILCIAY